MSRSVKARRSSSWDNQLRGLSCLDPGLYQLVAWTQGSISWWSPEARPGWAGKLRHGVNVTVQSLSPGCGWEPPGTRAGRSQAGRSHAGAALGKAVGRAPGRRQRSSPSAACSLLLALQTWVAFWLSPSRKVSEWLGRASAAQTPASGGCGWESGFHHPIRTCGVTAVEEDLGAEGYWQLKGEGNFPLSTYGTLSLSSNVDYSFPLPTGGALSPTYH